jgi:DNA-binding LacI/PurR family transcriptional regulator
MPVTLKDIAKKARVSRPAVSLYLNNPDTPHVSAENKQRIRTAAAELNYRPNYAARSLRGGASMTIGIVGGLFSVPVHDAINNALMHELWRHGYQVLLGQSTYNRKESNIYADLEARNVDAMIVTSAVSEAEKMKISVPYISVTHNQGQFDIAVDMEYGGYLAGRHLIKHGHSRIAYVSSTTGGEGRFRGLEKALAEAGLDSCERFRVKRDAGDVGKIISNLHYKEEVTAFFCINDFVAAAVMKSLQNSGVKVPEAAAVIGFDGLPFTEFTAPSLATIVQPVQELARQSVKLLFEKIKNKKQKIKNREKSVPILLKPYLLAGESCGCAKSSMQNIGNAGSQSNLDYFQKEKPCLN